jgi:hypothetical protein
VLVAGNLRSFNEAVTSKPIDLAVVNIQADHAHDAGSETAEETWQFCEEIGARRVMPVRHSTFHLTGVASDRSYRARHAEPADRIEPIDRFLSAAGQARHRIVGRQVGDTWTDLSDCRTVESIMMSSPISKAVDERPASLGSVNDVKR